MGTEKSLIKVINGITGKILEKIKLGNNISTLEFSSAGDYLYVGDIKGIIYTLHFPISGTGLKLIAKTQTSSSKIYSISYKSPIFLNQKKISALLISS